MSLAAGLTIYGGGSGCDMVSMIVVAIAESKTWWISFLALSLKDTANHHLFPVHDCTLISIHCICYS